MPLKLHLHVPDRKSKHNKVPSETHTIFESDCRLAGLPHRKPTLHWEPGSLLFLKWTQFLWTLPISRTSEAVETLFSDEAPRTNDCLNNILKYSGKWRRFISIPIATFQHLQISLLSVCEIMCQFSRRQTARYSRSSKSKCKLGNICFKGGKKAERKWRFLKRRKWAVFHQWMKNDAARKSREWELQPRLCRKRKSSLVHSSRQ